MSLKHTTGFLPPLLASVILLADPLPVIAADQSATTGAATQSGAESMRSATTTAQPATTGDVVPAKPRLKGGVSEYVSPILEDAPPEVVPEGTTVNLTLNTTVNSEISVVGDDVMAAVTLDVKDKGKVLLPGQWYVVGKVTRVESQRRLGRNGYVEIKFDKLISPDGKLQLPIDASVSTHEGTVKTVAKHLATDSKFMTTGAVGGALLSLQLGGIGTAIMTEGISVGGGAAVGATIGLIAALWRKGRISSSYTGEFSKFRVTAPITLPAFNPNALPSAEPAPNKLASLDIVVHKAKFRPSPYGDKRSRLLKIDFALANRSNQAFSLANLVVMSDSRHFYYPEAGMNNLQARARKVLPNTSEQASITFGVDSPKHKYWLVLIDVGNSTELTRVPVN
jgi:hypothetical protein